MLWVKDQHHFGDTHPVAKKLRFVCLTSSRPWTQFDTLGSHVGVRVLPKSSSVFLEGISSHWDQVRLEVWNLEPLQGSHVTSSYAGSPGCLFSIPVDAGIHSFIGHILRAMKQSNIETKKPKEENIETKTKTRENML